MEVLYPRCAGLDVHKDTVVAAVRLIERGGSVRWGETFATTTPELRALSVWLERHDWPSIAMEATGIYWRPVRQVLAADGQGAGPRRGPHADPRQRRAREERAQPHDRRGRRNLFSDLLAHGLIRPSFVPTPGTRAMRDLCAPSSASAPRIRACR